MKITVYNFKGGVGKSAISLNLALTLKLPVLTNDHHSPVGGIVKRVLGQNEYRGLKDGQDIPAMPADFSCIFDLGGHIDPRAVHALEMSDVVLVPLFCDYVEFDVTLKALKNITRYNSNVIVVANRVQKKEFQTIKKIISGKFPELPILELKKSTAMTDLYTFNNGKGKPKGGRSIKQMLEVGGLVKYNYTPISEQFDRLIEEIYTMTGK